MKFVIIGLGNFGASLGKRLIEEGHEVIGVDNSQEHTDLLKDTLTFVVCADTTEERNIEKLPIEDADYVIVSIGEDVGASLSTTALIKRHYKTQIIARGISYIHTAILESMNVHEIINPEAEFANQMAERFSLKGSLKAYPLDDNYEIAEIDIPESLIGKKVSDLPIEGRQLSLVTILRQEIRTNFLGSKLESKRALGIPNPDAVFQENDVLVVFGRYGDLQKMCAGEFIKE
ncbi:MAG: potassium channel family protein [Saprospiraceae bacterium]